MNIESQTAGLLKSLVPISRFNKGEAAKIFDEVGHSGVKIVVRNNIPTCVLLSPAKYEAIVEELENKRLLEVALERLDNDNGEYFTNEEVMARFGITQNDIDNADDEEIE